VYVLSPLIEGAAKLKHSQESNCLAGYQCPIHST